LDETLLEPDATDQEATVLALDALWSFVLKKTNPAWIWIVLCRKTRQVVAYTIGDRSEAPCRRLWETIPLSYRASHCFTDFWAAYRAVIRSASSTVLWEKTQEKRPMSSGGTIRCDSVWPADDAQNAVVLPIARDASGMPRPVSPPIPS
jgi:IS1 family transposase